MKKIIILIIGFVSAPLFGQEKIDVKDLLPGIYFHKQELTGKYSYSELFYDSIIQNIEQKEGNKVKIMSRGSTGISYKEFNSEPLKDITYNLTFNENKQLVKWESDLNDCYDRSGSDVPEPALSAFSVQYNQFNKIEQISGHCATKEFSTRTNYYYDNRSELDSIIFREGYSELNVYRKIIFIDTTIKSGEVKSTMAFILNTPFEYEKWMKNEPGVTRHLNNIQNLQSDSVRSIVITRPRSETGLNYVYEFDSLGRITSLLVLNGNAEYSPLIPGFGCEFCEENCEFPSVFEFYYENDQIAGLELTSFGNLNDTGNCMCHCLIYLTYRKEKIKEINYYAGLDDSQRVLVKKWTKRKGFQDVEADNSK